jgi:hypothetical protein
MNVVIEKKINTNVATPQTWKFPEGTVRRAHGLSPDGTSAYLEVDPDTKPGLDCVVQVIDLGKPLIGGVLGAFKNKGGTKVASTTCIV